MPLMAYLTRRLVVIVRKLTWETTSADTGLKTEAGDERQFSIWSRVEQRLE
jgi:hypothetical protein